MDNNSPEKSSKSHYALLNKITVIFIFAIAVLLFFSKTIYEYNLPSVTVDYVKEGFIVNTLRAEGFVVLDGEVDILSGYDGQIELLVEEGQEIKEGDILFTITSDSENIEEEIEALEKTRNTLNISISKLSNDIAYYNANDNSISEVDSLDLTSHDYKIEKLRTSLESASKELSDTEKLFAEGAVAQYTLSEAESNVKNLEMELQSALNDREKAIETHNKQIDEKNKESTDKERQNTKTITDLNYQLSSARIERDYITRQLDSLNEQLMNSGITQIVSEYTGMVTIIKSEARTGRYINKNTIVLSILPQYSQATVRFNVSNKMDYMVEGDAVSMSINSRRRYDLPGKITKIYYYNQMVTIEAQFDESIQFTGGEKIEALFERRSKQYPTIIPNSAVREGEGKYLLYIEKVDTSFGYDYIARQIGIKVADIDPNNSYINWASERGDDLPIIINSDKAVLPGDKIKIVGKTKIQ